MLKLTTSNVTYLNFQWVKSWKIQNIKESRKKKGGYSLNSLKLVVKISHIL